MPERKPAGMPGRVVLLALCCSAASPGTVAAQTQGLNLACSRGALALCETALRRPRLAPGTRAAIEQHLSELRVAIGACEAGTPTACRQLLERYPELPREIRLMAASLIARGGR